MSQPDGAGVNRQSAIQIWNRLSPNLRGMMLMAFSACVVAVLHTIARALTAEYHAMQIAFFRTTVPLIFLIPMLMRQGRLSGTAWWHTTRPGMHLLRGVLGAIGMMTWFFSLSLIPVGDATAITFSVVIFASIGAVVFLGERVGPRRIAAIAIGLMGTLIIVRPDTDAINLGAIVALVSSVFWAATLLVVKVLARTESSPTIVFYASVYFTVFVTPFAIYFWKWPEPEDVALMVLVGVLALLGQLALTGAMRSGEATAVMPIDFTRLLWAAGIGYIWFGEFPDLWTWTGGAVVFASTLYITYRESRYRKPSVAEDPGPPR
jgi:drug/metabolite transporter (DMT)-like permease